MSGTAAQAGDVAVVTGAASGIGAALSRRAAALGMKVAITDVQTSAIEALSAALNSGGAETFALPVDVGSWSAVEELAAVVHERWGSTTMLFNNAATMVHGKTWETRPEDWKRTIDIGLNGVFHGIRAFLPRMLAQSTPSHVINIASVGALRISPYRSSYSAAKHGCLALTEALALELAEVTDLVHVSAVLPGPVRTGISRTAISADTHGAGARSSVALSQSLEERGIDPVVAARIIFQGVEQGDLHIHTDLDLSSKYIEERHSTLRNGLT